MDATTTHHVVPPRVYVTIFLVLMVLTAVTTAIAYVDLGILNVVFMLGIAVTKATLVVLWFMHARWSSAITRLVIGITILFLGLLIVPIAHDMVLRYWAPGVLAVVP
jgi:cytochrome c oxidase subunit 4